jgi:hypothetical protein
MKRFNILLAGSLFFLFSCKKELSDNGGTNAQKMANEWWVTLDKGNTPDTYGIGHFKLLTYNTAANKDSIWVDDYGNGWGVKFKAAANFNDLSFSATNAKNEYYPITINLTEGKIFPSAGHSRSGNIVDSIHMKVEFSDDPGVIYQMNGTARTSFIEDEY